MRGPDRLSDVTASSASARAGPFDVGLLIALFAIAASTYPYAALIIDSGRDLAWGLSIARGDAFPMYGPSLNGLWQLGPIWYYLLALPLMATGSVGATAAFIGLLAACKIPLAYRVGTSYAGAGFGLAFAAMIALPGWSTLGQLVLSHTSLTEVGVLATLALSLRAIRRRSVRGAIGAALMLGLAMHAHPTALVGAPAVAIALWQTARHQGQRRWLLLAGAAFVAPLVPALLAEAAAGWPQWRSSAGYFGNSDYLARLGRLPRVLHGMSVGQWQFAQEFLLSRWPLPGTLLGAVWVVSVGLALVGLIWRGWRDRLAMAVAALLLGAWLFVLLLRDHTPVWMIYAWTPMSCALLAVGWQCLWPARRMQIAARTLAAASVLLGGGVLFDRMMVARDGVQYLPGDALADVAAPVRRDQPVRFWLPSWAHDAAFVEFCAGSPGLSVHGELAAALGFAQGVAYSLHCPSTFDLTLGGAGRHDIAGIPIAVASQLELGGRGFAGGYALIEPVRVLAPPRGERVALHRRYRVDDFSSRSPDAELNSLAIHEPCTAGEVLVIANLLPGLNSPFQILPHSAEKAPRLMGETLTSRYYACPDSGAFMLRIDSLDASATDVFVIGSAVR
jgi:hypothetical protein